MQYILSSVGIKENIILKSNSAPHSFTVQYRIGELTAEQESDKSILLKDGEGNTVYTIEAPVMTDAAGISSDNVTVQIRELKNKKMTVEITADRDWLNEAGREFPVAVDPDFTTSQKSDTVSTTYLSSSNPTTSYGKGGTHYEGSIYVGRYAQRGMVRSLIRHEYAAGIVRGDVTSAAQMHLRKDSATAMLSYAPSAVQESGVPQRQTWNNASSLKDSIAVDYHYADFADVMDLKTKSWDITTLMKGWYDGTYVNNGVMLTADSESGTSDSYSWYYSSDYPDAEAARPVFTIVYRNSKARAVLDLYLRCRRTERRRLYQQLQRRADNRKHGGVFKRKPSACHHPKYL